MLLMIIWATWRNRNAKVWDGDVKLASKVVPIILGWWEEYRAVHALAKVPRPVTHELWKKPPVGLVKLYVDVAFDNVTGCTGVGGIFRDSRGSCVGGFRHYVSISNSARHGELLALLYGVKLAIAHHFVPLMVEIDCQDLVTAIESSSLNWTELGFLVHDLEELLKAASNAQVCYVHRSANRVAHTLAQKAKHGSFSLNSFIVSPPRVEELIILECNDI
ncbi:uncharacterized protein LOC112177834 [Rosa chinensis]|uniref:uncharacterized protein LOC112177834 n=1 Tax=Rosa chinensis TaxID=74649 RepID=UPI000D09503C|nr:uncharacterized protein LOC112177834 [Rosa chinensis]